MFERFDVRKGLKGFQLATIFAVLVVPLIWGATLPQSAPEDAMIFQEKYAGCDTIGAGALVRPVLMGVITQRRDLQWLAGFIAKPHKKHASGDLIASSLHKQYDDHLAMTNLSLSHLQVKAVMTNLESQAEVVSRSQPSVAKVPCCRRSG